MLVKGYSPFSAYSDCNHIDNNGSESEYNLSEDLLINVELPRPVEEGDSQTKKNFRYFFWSFFTAPSSRRFLILYLGC